jgi:transposase
MLRLSRSDISRIYHEGEEVVIRLIESLHDAVALLEARVGAVEEQQKKSSKTSSKPPSSDGLRRTVSQR